jgi:hypothetical protein
MSYMLSTYSIELHMVHNVSFSRTNLILYTYSYFRISKIKKNIGTKIIL